ncbi:reverse transcriptase domain-containing protein [Tanacetum coccineum]
MLVEVGKFTFPVDFVILEMEEDSKVPLILGRPFLHTTDVVIHVKQKQLNLGVGSERMIFSIVSVMKHFYSNDDSCFSIEFKDSLAYQKLSLGSSIYRVWKLIDASYREMWDTMYWGFLGVRTTFDIFQNILLLYYEYGILMSPGYNVLSLQSFMVICEV